MIYIERIVRQILLPIENAFGKVFADDWNPWHQLGAIAFFMFWIAIVSGVYLYIFFDTSIFGAFASVERLTHNQWFAGGIMRSLHRYASDAMVVVVTLHIVREFSLGRFRHARWFSWISGVPLLWLLFAAAIGGYWLVWDELALYIAVRTSEWLDWLPFFNNPIARNFLSDSTLNDRFFSLLVFSHIAIPLFLLLGMFIHIKRVSKAKTNPSKGLAIGMLMALIVLSLIKPATSMLAADLKVANNNLALDWFYLNLYPLMDLWGAGWVWLIVTAITGLLIILPWIPSKQKQAAIAVVDPENCNGCTWCFHDCPYEAVTMTVHDYKSGARQAVVDPELCTSCGICAGSCPSATPFRHISELVTGIDMPDRTINSLLAESEEKINQLTGETKIIVFGCDHAAQIKKLADNQTAVVSLSCTAQLPPSFVDYCLRRTKAKGVFVTGCGDDCFYRKGAEWVEQRFAGTRMPHLRTSAAKTQVKLSWAGPMQLHKLKHELQSYRQSFSNAEAKHE